jgi:hypothetical protein
MPDDSREQLQFDVERYVRSSKRVDISDLDLSQAAGYPISDEEVRALTYMTDIESHPIVCLRAILNTCAVEDPQTTAFLSCWAYEEFFHGQTLRQFLNAVGVAPPPAPSPRCRRPRRFWSGSRSWGRQFYAVSLRIFTRPILRMGRSRSSQLSKAMAYWRARRRNRCWRKSCAGRPRTSAAISPSITTKHDYNCGHAMRNV